MLGAQPSGGLVLPHSPAAKRQLQIYSMIERKPSNELIKVQPQDKNLELRIVVLEKIETILTKTKSKITKYLIADETASVYLNVFDDAGDFFKPGDVLYMNGGYASIYKNQLILYQGLFL
eukprot:TRINITY_DN5607_c0_g2_i1.p2 TRINITY_DN5607_c0_g2~~TRINITY_DN5607_c0_g2_i1.p2  ORF type:complete len:120 (-),score=13.28 TRINITY_DN5607_c0_g2_i1:610-969(-)